jgi:phage baseplate assembly protein W
MSGTTSQSLNVLDFGASALYFTYESEAGAFLSGNVGHSILWGSALSSEEIEGLYSVWSGVAELATASPAAQTTVSVAGTVTKLAAAAPSAQVSVSVAGAASVSSAAAASATVSVLAAYVYTPTAPVFTVDTPPVTASVGTAYSYAFVATGAPTPTYSLSSGSLPPGLTLNATTGVLSGTPSGLGGVYLFEIEASNSSGAATTPVIALVVSSAPASHPVAYSPPITPHLALPLMIGPSGSFNVVVQDTLAEVAQSVSVLLGTMKGDRTMVPDYGVDDPTFASPNAGAITQAINQWEPRAAVVVTVNPPADNAQQNVNVQVALAAEASS